jgi:IclR family KDG regulon transcriptional repressor
MKINSIDRCLSIVDLLSRNQNGMKLSEISGELELNNSTTHHILQTLLPHDYVGQDPETKKYSLGFRFLEISRRILDNIDIRKIAGSHLHTLHDECREAVHLAVLRNGKVIYIDKIDTNVQLSLATYVGFATDAHAAAGGKILLSDLPEDRIRSLYGNGSLKIYGKSTISEIDQLLKELKNVKQQGYAIDDEEYYEGIRCVAAPIRAGGKTIASISITGSIFSVTTERIESELINQVMETGKRISKELRW